MTNMDRVVEMNATAKGLSTDLSLTLGERGLIKLVLDAVQTVDRERLKKEEKRNHGFRPQMLLTLLSYCYASRLYASRDIEWAIENERTVRYICARTFPGWCVLRRFRRLNRDLVQHCLALVFKQAWAWRHDRGEVDFPGFIWFEEQFDEEAQAEAVKRLDLAALMDGVESD